MSVCLVFLDGVGIGSKAASNPFARHPTEFFSTFLNTGSNRTAFDGYVVPTDARLGQEGLPQSATGQTTILTGINAAQVFGRHHSGFPGPTLRKVLMEHSIFLKLKREGKIGLFANAFTDSYFERRGDHVSATTWAVKAADIPFLSVEDLRGGRALAPDLTNQLFVDFGFDVPLVSPVQAGRSLADLVREFDFVLYEYPFTDSVGHARDMEKARRAITEIDQFLRGLLSSVDLSRNTVLLTSDHGNMEDLTTSVHTLNPVPTMVWGMAARSTAERIKTIQDITPVILSTLARP